MANTGRVVTLDLEQVYVADMTPTGLVKPNDPLDPDYIAPYTDTVACPIVYNTNCPTNITYTANPLSIAGSFEFEFSLGNATVNNPVVNKITYEVHQGGPPILSPTIILPTATPNYFYHRFTGLPAGNYSLNIVYLDSSDVIQQTCANIIPSVIIT